MSELPALYLQAKRLTIALREGLDRLESTEVGKISYKERENRSYKGTPPKQVYERLFSTL